MAHTQDYRPFPAVRPAQQRLATIAIVAGIHIGVIAAFVVGLNPKLVMPHVPPPIQTFIDASAPPPPPKPYVRDPILLKPTLPEVLPPVVPNNAQPDHQTITTVTPPDGMTRDATGTFVAAHGVMSTHTTPNYPPLAVRLGETGNVLLRLMIDETGAVTNASVERSRGYDDLDVAAVAWVKAHWRYTPAMRDGEAVATTADAMVTFRLTER